MPKTSERQDLLQSLDSLIYIYSLQFNDCSTNEEDELQFLLEMKSSLLATRYISPRIPRQRNSETDTAIWNSSPDEFKQTARMTRDTFERLVDVLSWNPIFSNNSTNPQKPVWLQALVALERLGSHGNGVSVGKVARNYKVSAGTVCNYTERVIEAILAVKDRFIGWPNASERRYISQEFKNTFGFPGVVGVIDGTKVKIEQKPADQGETYCDRNHQYTINVQLVCNLQKEILFVQSGWPGSTHDQTAFSHTDLYRHPHWAFSEGEYLLGDSGYALSSRLLTPYRRPTANHPDNTFFNQRISSARVCIEHVNGILKNRFSCLRGLRTQIVNESDVRKANDWIEACCVLHNFTYRLEDTWLEQTEPEETGSQQSTMNDSVTGEQLRNRIKQQLLDSRDI